MDAMKVKIKAEWAKLKGMTFQEKREYIWEYYKFPIIATTFLLILFGSLINTWFINPPKKEYLYIAWMDHYAPETQLTALSDGLTQALADDPERETVTISTFLAINDTSYDVAMYNRLLAMVSAAELDIFILGESSVTAMASGGYLAALDEVFTLLADLDEALAQRLAASAVTAAFYPSEEAAPISGMFAIPLADCPYLTALDLPTEDLYLGVVVNTRNRDRIARALQFIYA